MIPVFKLYSKYDIIASNTEDIVYLMLKFHYNYLQYLFETEMTHLVGKCRWCNQNYFIPQHVLYDIYEHI